MCRKLVWLVVLLVVLGPVASVWAGFDPALVAWWPFDEGTGTVAADGSGNGNDGDIAGGAQWVTGQLGGALQFNGSDAEVSAPHIPFDNRSFTIAMWINPVLSGSAIIFSQRDADSTNLNMHMRLGGPSSTDAPVRAVRFGFYSNDLDSPPDTFQDNTWYHVAFWYDYENQDRRIYVDGEQVAQDAGAPYLGAAGNTIIGSWDTSQFFNGIIDDVQIYHKALSDSEIGKIMSGLADQSLAQSPRPEDGSVDVPRDVVLSWAAGEFAATHDVYFGTSLDDVNAASRSNALDTLVSQGQTAASYDPAGVLDFGTTYYWRVDEVNAAPDSTIFKGEVWSFATEPFAYAIEDVVATTNGASDEGSGPERTVDGSGLNEADQHSTEAADMWLASAPEDGPFYVEYAFDRIYKLHEMLVWNYNVQFEIILGFGLKDVTVEYSANGTDWMTLGDVQFAKATAKATYEANTTVDFGGVPAQYVRLIVNSGHGMMGQYGLSEVRFLYIPAQAREPEPADGATDVDPATTLNWRSGREAASHEVYLGTDPNALPLAATVDQASYTPDTLEFGGTYHWQIVEVNEADETPAWGGDVWNFSTQEYALIDGFETYDDNIEAGTTIFDTWLDGWVNETGSTVGYFDAPFAEKTIVRSGIQSMPLQYDNTTGPFYSEATREFATAQDWTGHGADTLVLYVRGNAPDFKETADGQIIMSAIGTDIWGTADQFRYAYKNLAGDGSIVVRVDSLVNSNEWAKAGVMVRETLEAGSKHAFAAVTPTASHGLSFQRRPVAGQDSANTDVADIEIPHWVKLTRTGNLFTMQQSEDGVTWVDVTPTEPVEIQMADSVYIGLAVTSHDAAITTAAEFSNLTTTGNISGGWQMAEIGVAQPVGNSAESMYVTIEDASGQSATVANANAAITVRPTWQEWTIPYSELSGVNLSRIEAMTIGVGDVSNPTAGGTGTVYIDDIGFGSPAAQ